VKKSSPRNANVRDVSPAAVQSRALTKAEMSSAFLPTAKPQLTSAAMSRPTNARRPVSDRALTAARPSEEPSRGSICAGEDFEDAEACVSAG
jgi:hypothetical protein